MQEPNETIEGAEGADTGGAEAPVTDDDSFIRGSLKELQGDVEPPAEVAEPAGDAPEEEGAPVEEAAPAEEEAEPAAQEEPVQPEPEPAKPAEDATPVETAPAPPEPTEAEEVPPFSYEAWRESTAERLEGHFAINDEDAAQMLQDPQAVVPRMMARVYADLAYSVSANLQQIMPQMVERALEQRDAQEDDLSAFFEMWPSLKRKDPQHMNTITSMAEAMRAQAPKMDKDTLMKRLGPAAMVSLGLPLQTEQRPAGTVRAKPPAPAAGRTTSSGKVERVGPTRPPTFETDPAAMWDNYSKEQ